MPSQFTKPSVLFLLASGVLLLAGCGGDDEVRIYKISHPEGREDLAAADSSSAMPPSASAPMMPPPAPMPGAGSSVNPSTSMTVLPGMEDQAAAIETPDWTVPAGWEELPPTSIRKGNFRITDGAKVAEITVTAFPGDAGGLEANVNRWRQQIGLPAASGAALERSIGPMEVDGQPAYYIDLLNIETPDAPSILGAVVPRGSQTWFVKMVGDTSVLAGQPPALKAFLGSIRF